MKRKRNRNKSQNSQEKYAYVPVYSKADYEKDERDFSKSEKTGKINWSAFQRLMLRDLCTNSHIIETGYIGEVKLEDAELAPVSYTHLDVYKRQEGGYTNGYS